MLAAAALVTQGWLVLKVSWQLKLWCCVVTGHQVCCHEHRPARVHLHRHSGKRNKLQHHSTSLPVTDNSLTASRRQVSSLTGHTQQLQFAHPITGTCNDSATQCFTDRHKQDTSAKPSLLQRQSNATQPSKTCCRAAHTAAYLVCLRRRECPHHLLSYQSTGT